MALRQAISDDVVIERKPQMVQLPNGRLVMGVLASVTFPVNYPIPGIISILVGETIYNLRAALDYLVYELARFDSGEFKDRTQFPIDEKEEVFVGRRHTYLIGVNDEHIAAIKRLQPFDGCDWTRRLRDLSNPDKHRKFTIIKHPVTISPSQGSTEAIIAGETVDVKKDVSINVALSDGTPVIESLKQLQSEVAQVLDVFKPEFER